MLNIKLLKKYKTFITYCFIGVSGVTLDFLIFLFLTKWLAVHYQLANFISVNTGIGNNFFWNVRYNFKLKDKLFSRFTRFYLVGYVGLLVSSLLLYLLIDIWQQNAVVAKIITMVFVVLIQFNLNLIFTFSKK